MGEEFNNYKTADLVIQSDLGQVKIGDQSIHLGPINMKVLVLLVQNQGQVVTRSLLFDEVWKNQIVSDDTLTRCISDLRNKLGKYSSCEKLIVTVPKRGYQWNPSQDVLNSDQNPSSKVEVSENLIKPYINIILAVILGLFILSTSTLWIANLLTRPTHIPILLIPIEIDDSTNQAMANKIEDSLRNNILKTNKIRFLSNTVVRNKNDFSLTNLSKQYGMQWAIEAKIRTMGDSFKITLSLVDTRTALEIYSKSIDNDGKNTNIDKFCIEFINDLDQRLRL